MACDLEEKTWPKYLTFDKGLAKMKKFAFFTRLLACLRNILDGAVKPWLNLTVSPVRTATGRAGCPVAVCGCLGDGRKPQFSH